MNWSLAHVGLMLGELNPKAAECNCFRPYIQYGTDSTGGVHPNEGVKGKLNPLHKSLKEYIFDGVTEPRGARTGLLKIGLERVDSEECKNTRCKYINAGIEEYVQDGHGSKGGITGIRGTFKDNNLDVDGSSAIASRLFGFGYYNHTNSKGHDEKWQRGLIGFVEAYDLEKHEWICRREIILINPKQLPP